MTRRGWLRVVQTLLEHTQLNLELASSQRTLQAAKILPSRRFLSDFLLCFVCFQNELFFVFCDLSNFSWVFLFLYAESAIYL